MNIAYDLGEISLQNIFFLDSKKNIIMDGKFTKIVYSDDMVSTSGISIAVPIKSGNKTSWKFQTSKLIEIEQQVIDYYKSLSQSNKTQVFVLRDHVKNGNIKIYRGQYTSPNANACYIVKISGIWEDQTSIGLTYKFIETYPVPSCA
jgi:hypothetical protein